jgi:hypothetical protein
VSPIRNEYNLGRPKFVADEGSVMLRGTGAEIDWSDVAAGPNGIKKLGAGTLMWIDPATGKMEPADTGNGKDANGILVSDCDETMSQNKGFQGVYLGGHFYENLMATPPDVDDKTALGPRFTFIVYEDSRLD